MKSILDHPLIATVAFAVGSIVVHIGWLYLLRFKASRRPSKSDIIADDIQKAPACATLNPPPPNYPRRWFFFRR